jgi:hypothetical protein
VANRIVTLTKPIDGHELVRELEFREPTWSDYMEIGEAFVWTPRGDGFATATPVLDNIRVYAERLIARGAGQGDPSLLGRLNLVDSRAVRDAIMGFFLDAEKASEASRISSTTSSSSSDGTPAPSNA